MLNGSPLPQGLNYTHVVLIPKNRTQQKMLIKDQLVYVMFYTS